MSGKVKKKEEVKEEKVEVVEDVVPSRSKKNQELYKEVYGKYDDLDNLPVYDNANEIDLKTLKELILSSEDIGDAKNLRDSLDVLDTRKRKIDKDKIYDINKILEKAKNDNSKLKETTVREAIIDKDILSTLESREISIAEIREASIKFEEKKAKINDFSSDEKEIEESLEEEEKDETKEAVDDNLTMTREFKFKELSESVDKFNSNPLIEQVMSDNDLSLDLFEELKPTGNTIVTKPIKDMEEKEAKPDIHSDDTRDIDIIKDSAVKEAVDEFFTSSYEFTSKDFQRLDDGEEFFETKKDGSIVKIIILLVAIFLFAGAIVYFIMNYGLGL